MSITRNIRTTLALGFILFYMFACNQTQDGELVPPINVNKMGTILLELQYAEQKSIGKFSDSLSKATKKLDRNFDSLAYYYQEVLDRNEIDFQDFVEYLDWYKQNAQFLAQALDHAKELLVEHQVLSEEGADEKGKINSFLLDEDLKQEVLQEHLKNQGVKSIPIPEQEEEQVDQNNEDE